MPLSQGLSGRARRLGGGDGRTCCSTNSSCITSSVGASRRGAAAPILLPLPVVKRPLSSRPCERSAKTYRATGPVSEQSKGGAGKDGHGPLAIVWVIMEQKMRQGSMVGKRSRARTWGKGRRAERFRSNRWPQDAGADGLGPRGHAPRHAVGRRCTARATNGEVAALRWVHQYGEQHMQKSGKGPLGTCASRHCVPREDHCPAQVHSV